MKYDIISYSSSIDEDISKSIEGALSHLSDKVNYIIYESSEPLKIKGGVSINIYENHIIVAQAVIKQ